MAESVRLAIERMAAESSGDRSALLSLLEAVQARFGSISDEAIRALADTLGLHRVEVADTASFYSFFRRADDARLVIRLPKCPNCFGPEGALVAEALSRAIEASPQRAVFELSSTSCLGMCDQGPAALAGPIVCTRLTPPAAEAMIDALGRAAAATGPDFQSLHLLAHLLPNARVESGLRLPGPVLFQSVKRGAGLWRALSDDPEKIIEELARSRLRGRGGAGFPTANKWRAVRQARSDRPRYVICNADEGEPGTFKDRALLSDAPDLVFEGMTIAGYALGAREGIVYLRAEYAYLWDHLQRVLSHRRKLGLLGEHVCGSESFGFDIRLQLGAGAYICGEETALIESLEGKRGAPRDRPPFPPERGYLDSPTTVNNVETYACVARILERGGDWFASFGTRDSTGTKLMSVAGDCERPGVYEVPFGITLDELLELAGGVRAAAVQVGGPSGRLVAPKDYGRQLCYEDLSTVGSTMVFSEERDLLEVVAGFQEFFADESCGWCAPCRVGTTLLRMNLEKIRRGRGTARDWQGLLDLGGTVKRMSRCGLGQSAANPLLSASRDFPEIFEALLLPADFIPRTSLEEALAPANELRERAKMKKPEDG